MNPVRDLINVVAGVLSAGKPIVPDSDKQIDAINGRPLKISSQRYTQTSGDSIGYQCKPDQRVTTTGDVFGAQLSPRVQAAAGCNRLVGHSSAPIIKGSSGVSGTVTNGVQCYRAELTDELGAGKTFSDDLVGYDVRGIAMESGHTYDSNVHTVGFRMGTSENSKAWDAVLKLSGTQAGVWNDTPGTEPSTGDGYIKVIVNNSDRYIQLFSTAPTD